MTKQWRPDDWKKRRDEVLWQLISSGVPLVSDSPALIKFGEAIADAMLEALKEKLLGFGGKRDKDVVALNVDTLAEFGEWFLKQLYEVKVEHGVFAIPEE